MAWQNMGSQNRESKEDHTERLADQCITLFAVVLVQIFSKNIFMLFDPESTDVIKEGILYH